MQLLLPSRFFIRLNQLSKRILFTSLLFLFTLSNTLHAEVSPSNGEKLFKQYCTSCHKAAPFNVKVVGPALAGVEKKRSEEWLLKWIHNNSALRASGDPDAIAIYNEYKSDMPAFASFTEDDIKSIIAYIANPPIVGPPPPPPPPPGGEAPSVWLYLVIIALLIIIIMLFKANKGLRRMALEREGHEVPEDLPWGKRLTSSKAYGAYGLILIFFLGWTLTSSTIRFGHSKNYSPEQPIHFPHDLHAGIAQINCLYCHSGAEKSKVAGIPTVSTCMNCHKGIQEGQTAAGTAEIKKIYDYYNNNRPIHWTKIHNLPDHVYFNHSQHVTVGKLACQTCHGPIQEMSQVYQFSSLSMGWCINCHRQTDVQFAQNGYYSMYTELQEKVKNETGGAGHEADTLHVTEAMMGGIECQKCHY